ncbi:YlxR family protein [Klenkia sp. PcliD-1-E]|uniref:YlxR family protein n=1 Tax=Klenkia sp. PcliD-1-E TaxID=2954492 RepID=UPI0020972506|nr:YlxR family protein [Klenkia sp. PcliD-1-E]MCO7222591.1 YlxR family protein [Klenkia sp. PcliD-1-E]
MAASPIPVRTCVGCRQRAPVTELLRVVVRDSRLVPDPARRLPGRGASVHPVPDCVRAAVRRRAFPRALRSSAPLVTDQLEDHVATPSPDGAPARPAPQQ